MDVMIIATKACTHRKNLENELTHMRIPYRMCFVEDCADLVQKFGIRHSTTSNVSIRCGVPMETLIYSELPYINV